MPHSKISGKWLHEGHWCSPDGISTGEAPGYPGCCRKLGISPLALHTWTQNTCITNTFRKFLKARKFFHLPQVAEATRGRMSAGYALRVKAGVRSSF